MKLAILSFLLVCSTFLHCQYCMLAGPTSTVDSNVKSVQMSGVLGTISHLGCPGVLGVQNLTTQNVTLNAGSTYSLSVEFGTCNGNYAGVGQVWIDFDQNMVFDPSESVGTWTGTPPSVATVFVVNVPANAQDGITRMRVTQKEGGVLPLNPCASFQWGSTMDFGITIANGMDCSGYIGDNTNDPIIVSAIPFTDSRDNSYCYSNDNLVYASPDIYYRYDVAPIYNFLNLSLCGASFDTFFSVLDLNGNVIAYNDDDCGSQSALSFSTLGLGTVYIIVEGWGNQMGTYTLNIESSDVGLEDLTGANSSLYPNPNHGEFKVSSAVGPVKIYNLMGALVFETVLIDSNRINASMLPNGTYFVQIAENNELQKLIINK
jgi:hypothetical protein